MKRGLLALLVFLTCATARAGDSRDEVVAQLQRIAAASGGEMGISALDVKGGERIQVNASARYPMASVVKVVVAIELLDQVDHHKLSLGQPVEIGGGDLSPGSGEILKDMDPGEPKMDSTVGELLEAMMTRSDNTATDHLMALVGGPKVVTERARALGAGDFDASRPTAELVADSWGFTLPPPGERTRKRLKHQLDSTPQPAREAAARRFLQDPRDTASPDALVSILEQLVTGHALSKQNTDRLLQIMARCKTGPKRLKGELPPGLPVAHKTGSLKRVAVNDVGAMTLPFGEGPIVVAVFVKGSSLPVPRQERAIADAAALLYRYYKR